MLFLPLVSILLAISIIFIAVTKYKRNTTQYSLLLLASGVFSGIFASSFSNYIQTIELERTQKQIVDQMTIGQISSILEKKHTQGKKVKSQAFINKFDNKTLKTD